MDAKCNSGEKVFPSIFLHTASYLNSLFLTCPNLCQKVSGNNKNNPKRYTWQRGLKAFGSAYKNSFSNKQYSTSRDLLSGSHWRQLQSCNALRVPIGRSRINRYFWSSFFIGVTGGWQSGRKEEPETLSQGYICRASPLILLGLCSWYSKSPCPFPKAISQWWLHLEKGGKSQRFIVQLLLSMQNARHFIMIRHRWAVKRCETPSPYSPAKTCVSTCTKMASETTVCLLCLSKTTAAVQLDNLCRSAYEISPDIIEYLLL